MRARVAQPLVALMLLAAPAAFAQGTTRDPPRTESPPAEKGGPAQPRSFSLEDLYARLAAAKDAEEAKGVASLIERRLERSGSDTADLLLARAGDALQGRDPALAVELLDRVTQLRPGWSEAWLRRAVAFWQLDDPARALTDLQEALVREPRHYTAWIVLGHLEMASGDKARAVSAYRRALRLHPFLDDAEKAVKKLAPDVDGRDL